MLDIFRLQAAPNVFAYNVAMQAHLAKGEVSRQTTHGTEETWEKPR